MHEKEVSDAEKNADNITNTANKRYIHNPGESKKNHTPKKYFYQYIRKLRSVQPVYFSIFSNSSSTNRRKLE